MDPTSAARRTLASGGEVGLDTSAIPRCPAGSPEPVEQHALVGRRLGQGTGERHEGVAQQERATGASAVAPGPGTPTRRRAGGRSLATSHPPRHAAWQSACGVRRCGGNDEERSGGARSGLVRARRGRPARGLRRRPSAGAAADRPSAACDAAGVDGHGVRGARPRRRAAHRRPRARPRGPGRHPAGVPDLPRRGPRGDRPGPHRDRGGRARSRPRRRRDRRAGPRRRRRPACGPRRGP